MNRISYLDITKGIGMLLVIWNHTCGQYTKHNIDNVFIKNLCQYSEAFWMPLFFIVSGVFINKNKDNFITFSLKRFKAIIIPLLFFYIFSYAASYVASKYLAINLHNSFDWKNIFSLLLSKPFSNGAIWFLSALFFSHILYFIIHEYSPNNTIKIAIILITSFIGYIWNYLFCFRLPFFIDTSMTALLFLHLGTYILSIPPPPKDFLTRSLLLVSLGTVVYLLKDYASGMVTNINNPYYVIPYYTVGLLGTIWVIILSQILSTMKAVAYLGEHSIVPLCCHFFFITPFKLISIKLFDNNVCQIISVFIMATLCMYPAIYFMCKYMPFLTGKTHTGFHGSLKK